jgi:hypothetical protein
VKLVADEGVDALIVARLREDGHDFLQGKLNAGIVLLRLAGVPSVQKAKIVSDALAAHGNEMRAAFSVVTKKILRIRPK